VITGQLFQTAMLRQWLVAFVAFVVVWAGVNALRPYADLNGPGTRGGLVTGFGGSQIENLTNRIARRPGDLSERVRTFLVDRMPALVGAKRELDGIAHLDRDWIAWPVIVAAVIAAVRVLMLARSARPAALAFIWYVLGVGVVAAGVFVIARPITDATHRYFLLALFIPVSLTAAWLALEPNRAVRAAIVVAVLGWSGLSAMDNVRQLRRYASGSEPNRIRELSDALEARGLRVAEAGYWRAYKITFLTRERLKLTPVGSQRIEEYRRLADQEGNRLLRLAERPCPGGEPVVEHYLCPK
jgi:hypothetical protein